MRLLLDTHTLLWWLDGDRRLSGRAKGLIGVKANEILVSAVCAWEIAIKARLGKLPGALDVAADVAGCLASQGFASLEISVRHAQRAGGLAWAHRDPFDRMLVAQAQLEDVPIVSRDRAFDDCAVTRLW